MNKCCKKCGATIFTQFTRVYYVSDVSEAIGYYSDAMVYGKYRCENCGANSWDLDELIEDIENE